MGGNNRTNQTVQVDLSDRYVPPFPLRREMVHLAVSGMSDSPAPAQQLRNTRNTIFDRIQRGEKPCSQEYKSQLQSRRLR